MSMLGIALTGLNAAQAGLTTASHNITNANVDGYTRQEALQSTNIAISTGSGFFGQGTKIDTVRRVYNQFLDSQVMSASTNKAMYSTYSDQISQIDNLLSDPSVGLSNGLDEFFSSVQDVSNSPASIPSRQAMLSASESLISNFQNIYDKLESVRSGVEQQITDSVASINSLSTQIADLNQRITVLEATGTGEPNDLLDQRDKLVSDLNDLVKTSVVKSDDGKLNVFIGNGQPLVVGNNTYELAALPSLDDPKQLAVGVVLSSNPTTIQEIPSSLINGGSLGGLLSFRSEALDSAENALGRIALGITTAFNAQHRLGQDLNGNIGLDYFTPLKVGTSGLINTTTGLTSTASVDVAVSNVGSVTTDDYILSYDGANYALNRKSDGSSVDLTGHVTLDPTNDKDYITVEGLSITVIESSRTQGDRILIQPTRNAANGLSLAITNTRQIAAAIPVTSKAATSNKGTGALDSKNITVSPTAPATTLSPLAGDITLTFDATNNVFNITGATTATIAYDPTTNATGLAATLSDGNIDISFKLSGVPKDGDTFTLSRTTSGVSDGRNALLLGQLQTKKVLEGSGSSFESAYAQMVSDIGTQAHTAETSAKAQETLLSEAQAKRDSVSGVNLDEEAANLLRYQQAYQASAKALNIASQLFDQILSLGS